MMYEKFRELFYYDASSPSCLRWRKSTGSRKVGDVAGSINESYNKDGTKYYRYRVCVDRKFYLVSRIVYTLKFENFDTKAMIDHLNGNSLDNRVENLRVADHKINGRNRRMNKNNTSGTTGVYFRSDRNTWIAFWHDMSGNYCQKSFSLSKHENAEELAVKYRNRQISLLSEYTDRHGLKEMELK